MATFFHGESEMREASSDPFMMNMNPFPDPTTTISAHNNHLYNLCFGSQQHPRQVSKLEQEHSSMSTVSNGGVTQTLRALGPVYLRAAQELLNEIVNVGNGNCCTKQEPRVNKDKVIYGMYDGVGDIKGGGHMADGDTCRQELQIKKAKLISMVEKVEQRYKQYHEQMQTIVSPFEQAAGLGSASAYTYMALQTISKQFRAVKDMICLQIKHINKLLGEKECEQLKRLGKIPHHHSNVWRPQRGLPETAVSVLRAWLFQHFLHPYPRDLDKEMLAKQTGLTKSQVSNWFINARVRVWKPMVEEMYLEEMNTEETRKRGNNKCSSSKQPYNNTTTEESSNSMLPVFHQGFIGNETSMQTSSSTCNVVTFKKQHVNQANLIHFNGCFENYHPTVGNRVSLSLGLPHSCDQTFNNIHFVSTSHGTEISGIYPTSTYQIMD